jgi:hypothetical protein
MKQKSKLLFHSPCFDGIVSAVLASDFLQHREQWSDIECTHVNYDARETWLTRRLESRTAIVDFLYHPDASFWADHHSSTFLTDDVRRDFESRKERLFIYDRNADSCAGLLWRRFLGTVGYRNPALAELVVWAEKIDAARYESVEEALSFVHPALQISASLAMSTNGYSEFLVRSLAAHPLDAVSNMPDVRERFQRFAELTTAGLARMREVVSLRDDIVVFDVDGQDVVIPRYSPYRFFPDARYSIGVVRGSGWAKVTAMRNPWLEFESVPLGQIFSAFGGGGHQRVASAYVPAEIDPHVRLEEMVSALVSAERLTLAV